CRVIKMLFNIPDSKKSWSFDGLLLSGSVQSAEGSRTRYKLLLCFMIGLFINDRRIEIISKVVLCHQQPFGSSVVCLNASFCRSHLQSHTGKIILIEFSQPSGSRLINDTHPVFYPISVCCVSHSCI